MTKELLINNLKHNPIKTLLIGLGNAGIKYDLHLSKEYILSHFKAITSDKEFKLIGAVDTDDEIIKKLSNSYSFLFLNSIKDISSKIENPDLIIVASTTSSHKDNICDILKYFNPKIILCEKPIAWTSDETKIIVNLCKKKNVKIFVNYFRRSETSMKYIRGLIKKNILKGYADAIVNYSGGFINNGSHFYDLFCNWFGEMIEFKTIKRTSMSLTQDFFWQGVINFEGCTSYFRPMKEIDVVNHSFNVIFSNAEINSKFAGRETIISWPVEDSIFTNNRIFGKNESIDNQYKQFQKCVYNDIKRIFLNLDHNLCDGNNALVNNKNIEKIIDDIKY